MKNVFRGASVALAVVVGASTLTGAPASAHADPTGRLPPDPKPVAEEGKRAKTIVDRLAADAETAAVVKPLLESAKKALQRAYAASLAGDADASRELSKIALAEATAAEATASSAKAEAKATQVAARVATLKTRAKEVKAAVDELEVERTRLRLEIDKLRKDEAARRAGDARNELDETKKKKPTAKKDKKEKKK